MVLNKAQQLFHEAGLVAKLFMAISITTAVFGLHKYYYAPYAKRQRYLKAEEWANMIVEQEEQLKKQDQQ